MGPPYRALSHLSLAFFPVLNKTVDGADHVFWLYDRWQHPGTLGTGTQGARHFQYEGATLLPAMKQVQR